MKNKGGNMQRMSILPAEDPTNSTDGLVEMIEENLDKTMTGVEIGSFEGVSTIEFAKRVKRVYAVDDYNNEGVDNWLRVVYHYSLEEAKERFLANIDGYDNIIFMCESSKDNYRFFDDYSLDFVYIDGDHTYTGCYQDINNYLPKVRIGGFIMGHDFNYQFQSVRSAVYALLGTNIKVYSDGSWAWKKR